MFPIQVVQTIPIKKVKFNHMVGQKSCVGVTIILIKLQSVSIPVQLSITRIMGAFEFIKKNLDFTTFLLILVVLREVPFELHKF